MTHAEYKTLQDILTSEPFKVRPRLVEFMKTVTVVEEKKVKSNWSSNQRKAFHVGCEELANYLNERGMDMRAVLKQEVDIPWNKDSVKNYIFRPIMKAMYGYESHTELKKIEEVSNLWDIAMKHLGERHHVEYMEFPHEIGKTEENMSGYKTNAGQGTKGVEYPEYEGAVKF